MLGERGARGGDSPGRIRIDGLGVGLGHEIRLGDARNGRRRFRCARRRRRRRGLVATRRDAVGVVAAKAGTDGEERDAEACDRERLRVSLEPRVALLGHRGSTAVRDGFGRLLRLRILRGCSRCALGLRGRHGTQCGASRLRAGAVVDPLTTPGKHRSRNHRLRRGLRHSLGIICRDSVLCVIGLVLRFGIGETSATTSRRCSIVTVRASERIVVESFRARIQIRAIV